MRILQRATYHINFLCLAVALFLACSACRNSAAHCYLCQGIPHNEPCIISLATGNVAVLSAGGYGHTELSFTDGISVTGINGESCRATIPIDGEEMNPALFCEDCRALIEATPNNGYVLADLHDLGNIQLYPIEDMTIRDYTLTVGLSDAGYEVQMVTS